MGKRVRAPSKGGHRKKGRKSHGRSKVKRKFRKSKRVFKRSKRSKGSLYKKVMKILNPLYVYHKEYYRHYALGYDRKIYVDATTTGENQFYPFMGKKQCNEVAVQYGGAAVPNNQEIWFENCSKVIEFTNTSNVPLYVRACMATAKQDRFSLQNIIADFDANWDITLLYPNVAAIDLASQYSNDQTTFVTSGGNGSTGGTAPILQSLFLEPTIKRMLNKQYKLKVTKEVLVSPQGQIVIKMKQNRPFRWTPLLGSQSINTDGSASFTNIIPEMYKGVTKTILFEVTGMTVKGSTNAVGSIYSTVPSAGGSFEVGCHDIINIRPVAASVRQTFVTPFTKAADPAAALNTQATGAGAFMQMATILAAGEENNAPAAVNAL